VPIQTRLKIFKGLPAGVCVGLIDVLFLMLVFFMLSSSFVEVSAIKIDLPMVQVESTPVVKLVVTIDKRNNIYFNDIEMDLNKLKEELGKQSSKYQIDNIIIRADKATPHELISEVLGLAKNLNLNAFFAMDTRGKDKREIAIDDNETAKPQERKPQK